MKTYVISIAISDYKKVTALPNAVKDSRDVLDVLESHYKIKIHKKLEDGEVSNTSIIDTFRSFKEKIKDNNPNDISLILFYNGHGALRPDGNELYWWLANSDEKEIDTWYSCASIFSEIALLKIKNVVFFMNCCYSGNIFFQKYVIKQGLSTNNGRCRILFTSGKNNQEVEDSAQSSPHNSPFIKAIIESLEENTSKEKLPLVDVASYISAAFDKKEYNSKPVVMQGFDGDEGGDFFFYLKEDEANVWISTQELDEIDAYDYYLQKYPKGEFLKPAENRKNELVQEQTIWIDSLTAINNALRLFIKKNNIVKSKFNEKAQKYLNDFENQFYQITLEQRAEKKWKLIQSNLDSSIFFDFEQEFPNTKYAANAKWTRLLLEKNENDKADWERIPNKNTDPSVRRDSYIAYTVKHKHGKYIPHARQKISDIEQWIFCLKESNEILRKQKIKKYLRDFDKGEYHLQAKRLLEKIEISLQAKQMLAECNKAIADNDIDAIINIVEHIEGLGLDERNANKEIFEKAKNRLDGYNLELKKDYEEAIIGNNPEFLLVFLQKYPKFAKKEEMYSILESMDDKTFAEAEEEKDIFIYMDYISNFELLKYNYKGKNVELADARIKELNFYNKLSTKSDFEEYLIVYPNGIMKNEAESAILVLKIKEDKTNKYLDALNSTSSETCEIYLLSFEKDGDDWAQQIRQKYNTIKINIESLSIWDEIQNTLGDERITLCEKYIYLFNDKETLYIEQIKQIKEKELQKKELTKKEQLYKIEEEAFNNAKKTNTISSWNEYLLIENLSNEDNIAFAKAKKAELEKIEKQNLHFEKALETNTEDAYLDYIAEYKINGIHYDKAMKKIAKIHLGVEQYDVLQKIDEMNNNFISSSSLSNDVLNKILEKIQGNKFSITTIIIIIIILLFIAVCVFFSVWIVLRLNQ